ncbi:hypothetical protein QFZ94_004744 [Paraburkholderia sp. JPY465]
MLNLLTDARRTIDRQARRAVGGKPPNAVLPYWA